MMSKKKLLIITSKDDGHADFIIHNLNNRGRGDQVIRLNTEDFVTNAKFTFTIKGFELHLIDSDKKVSNNEILSVWFRRPKEFVYNTEDEKINKFIHKQAQALLRGIYFCTHDSSLWLNPLTSLHRARIKLQQLVLAKKLGFNVPKTIVSNSREEIFRFVNNTDHISTKSLDEPNFQTDKNVYPIFNKKIQKNFINEHIDNMLICPTLLQEYIEKESDIRVVVINNTIFAFEIYSQENELSIEDFRGVSPNQLRHKLIELPEDIKKRILVYMKSQNLVYSSFDFVRSTNNKIFFIENNPNGQWLWLELQTEVKISETLIKTLFNYEN